MKLQKHLFTLCFITLKAGMIKMGKALNLDIYSDLFMPYFFYKCGCFDVGKCSLQEYAAGLSALRRKTFQDLKNDYMSIKEKLLKVEYNPPEKNQKRYYYDSNYNDQTDEFKKFYFWLFEFNVLNKQEKKDKKIQYEIAKFYWEQVFDSYYFIKDLISFLEQEKKIEHVKLDQWNCLLELVRHCKNNFPNNYCLEDSWPTLFDEFYIWYCKKNGIEVKMPEEYLGNLN